VADLGDVVDGLAVGVARARLTAREQWHVTVVFLGEAPAERAAEALRVAVADTAPFTLRFAGGGTFGRGRSTILWSGVDGDVEALRAMSAAIRRRLRRARLPYDRKPLRPHLTIARPGDRVARAPLQADLATLRGYAGPAWPAASVQLVLSEMVPGRPAGRAHGSTTGDEVAGTDEGTATGPKPRYTDLVSVPLAPARP
jgi:2'-5' RNA ligase